MIASRGHVICWPTVYYATRSEMSAVLAAQESTNISATCWPSLDVSGPSRMLTNDCFRGELQRVGSFRFFPHGQRWRCPTHRTDARPPTRLGEPDRRTAVPDVHADLQGDVGAPATL